LAEVSLGEGTVPAETNPEEGSTVQFNRLDLFAEQVLYYDSTSLSVGQGSVLAKGSEKVGK